jgi:SAM-dependent methyltransferase
MNGHRAAPPVGDQTELRQALDAILAEAQGWDGVFCAWGRLVALTGALKRTLSDEGWAAARDAVRAHPIHALALQDPFTRHSWEKPRGYSGDGAMIDHVYRLGEAPGLVHAASAAGRDVNTFVTGAPTCVAVRERLHLLARLVDSTAERTARAEILALGCGHLREAAYSRAVSEGALNRWLALDRDTQSVEEMTRSYAHRSCILPVKSTVGRLMVRPTVYGRFDLIYAAGLYEYLDDPTTVLLSRALLQSLKPGGRLLFANFVTDLRDEGYMDACMDWRVTQRDEAMVQAILDALPQADLANVRLFRGNNGDVVYAVLTKRA